MTPNKLQIKAQLVVPFLIITTLMLITWSLTQWQMLDRMVQSQRDRFVNELSQEWQAAVKATANAQENLLYQIATDKRLQEAYRNGDRARLLALTAPMLKHYQQTAGVSHLYFHTKEEAVFLRAHSPDLYGDKINRTTLKQAIRTNTTHSGIEMSGYGQTLIHSVQPWYLDKQLIGYLELGSTLQPILDWISGSHDIAMALMINKMDIDKNQWLKRSNHSDEASWQQYPQHLLIAYTGTPPEQDLQDYFTSTHSKFHLNREEIGILRSQTGITDLNNRVIGSLLIEKSFAWLVDDFSALMRSIITAFLFLITLTSFLYAYYARRLNGQLIITYRTLNTEIESRKAAEDSLLEHKKSLENTILQRTEALQRANENLVEDINLREETERWLSESTQKYRALFNGSTDIILVLKNNRLIEGNITAHEMLNLEHIETKHHLSLNDLLKCNNSPPTRCRQWLREAQENGMYRAEMSFEGCKQTFPVDVVITFINEPESSLFLVTCRDISERKAAQAKVEYQALYDPLTDLPNRRLFMEELQRATQLCRRQNQKGAILFIDLDHFKNINDTLGHSVGDLLLEEVAKRLKAATRAEDTVARFGGDEFVVIIPCCGDKTDQAAQKARSTAEKISQALIDTYPIAEHQLHVTPSIGVAIFPKLNETTEDILKQADVALYGAKGAGRNTIRFFEPKMQDANEKRLTLEKELRKALERDQMFINLQTKHNGNGDVIGSECLLRWKHPELGMVSPFHFIAIAEETGMISHIGKWVIEQVAQWIAYCIEHKLPEPYSRVAINLSPLQLFQPHFVNELWGIIQKYQVPPDLITLEITENVLIKDFDSVVKLLQKLKDLGFMISVDDFGTGYSSLRYLKSLPIDELKIDQSFVREIHTNTNDRAIADTIISMARHLSLKVVAEGVEIPEQLALLIEQGCDRFQGYHFAKPITTGELLSKINTKQSAAG